MAVVRADAVSALSDVVVTRQPVFPTFRYEVPVLQVIPEPVKAPVLEIDATADVLLVPPK